MDLQEVTVYHENSKDLELLANFLVETYKLNEFRYDEGNLETKRLPSFFFLCEAKSVGEILISAMKLPGVYVQRAKYND